MQQEIVHGSGVAPACLARLSSSSAKRNKHIISISVVRENMEKELTLQYWIFLTQFTVTQLVKNCLSLWNLKVHQYIHRSLPLETIPDC
jgi:hypothetical protein